MYTVVGKLSAVLSCVVFPSLTWTWRLWFEGRVRITILLQLMWCRNFSSSRATVISCLYRCCYLWHLYLFLSISMVWKMRVFYQKPLLRNAAPPMYIFGKMCPWALRRLPHGSVSACFMQTWTQSFLCLCTANINFSFWVYVCHAG